MKVPDGIYTILVRTIDVAGNTSGGGLGENTGRTVTVIINNAPPHIKLTPEWFIWDSGAGDQHRLFPFQKWFSDHF